MQIQKGIVKYKDRSDINCMYGITDDGKQYYFLDETDTKKFSNGNRIASTLLVEAIDPMVKASNVGVIDENGNVVIPFDNRSIKQINDDIILVEKAQPVSKSVIDSIALKSDPSFATQLVSTPATIKERLNAKMGVDGRYFFNDQFSEATVCDINGNNLVNNEYFSFIGMGNGKLYFSKNTVDSEVTEYSILPPEVQSDVTPANDSDEIDVNEFAVSKDVVEGALSGSVMPEEKVEESSSSDSIAVTGIAPVVSDEEDNDVLDEVQSSVGFENIEIPSISADEEEQQDMSASTIANDTTGFIPTAGEIQNVADDVLDNGEDVADEEESTSEKDSEGTVENDLTEESSEKDSESTSLEEIENDESTDETQENNSDELEEDADKIFSQDFLSSLTNLTEMNNETEDDSESELKSSKDDEVDNRNIEETDDTSDDHDKKDDENMRDDTKEDSDKDTDEVSSDDGNEADDVSEEEEKTDEASEPLAEETDEDSTVQSSDLEKDSLEDNIKLKIDFDIEKAEKELEDLGSAKKDESEVEIHNDVENNDDSENFEDIDKVYDSYDDSTHLDDISVISDSVSDEINKDFSNYSELDEAIFKDSILKADKIMGNYMDTFEENSFTPVTRHSSRDTIMMDVANSMANLIKQNKEQRNIINRYQERYEKLSAARRSIADKAEVQEQKIDVLTSKIRTMEAAMAKLESKNQSLESKVREQEKMIAAQAQEINDLRPQLAGKEDLVKVLADAQLLLGQDNSYSYDY